MRGEGEGASPLPAWQLELLRKRKSTNTSASFSAADHRRPNSYRQTFEPPPNPKDIIRFFNSSSTCATLAAGFDTSGRVRGGEAAAGGQVVRLDHSHPTPGGERGGAPAAGFKSRASEGLRGRGSGGRGGSRREHHGSRSGGATVTTPTNTYHYQHPSDRRAANVMGEDKRLFLSNGGGGADLPHSGGVGARLLRGRQAKRNAGRTNGAGDSDGMMGSGGESDSSEEIHYGPGFVSRLKSRYMSVALRGSARGSLGSLRRTASLEDFLELDKNRSEEEVELRQHAEMLAPKFRHSAPSQPPPPVMAKVGARVGWLVGARMNCERLDGVASLLNPDALSADFKRSQMLNIGYFCEALFCRYIRSTNSTC